MATVRDERPGVVVDMPREERPAVLVSRYHCECGFCFCALCKGRVEVWYLFPLKIGTRISHKTYALCVKCSADERVFQMLKVSRLTQIRPPLNEQTSITE